MDFNDYLIDTSDLDWDKLIESWQWQFDPDAQVSPWLMNTFGDLFWLDERDAVHCLNVTEGTNELLASSDDEFFDLLQDEDLANDWFLMGLVNEFREHHGAVPPGKCLGFKKLPIFGADYVIENIAAYSIDEYWAFCGDIHHQIATLPSGTPIQFRIQRT